MNKLKAEKNENGSLQDKDRRHFLNLDMPGK